MNPDFSQLSRADLEVKVTALLLDELDPAEATALRAWIDRDPELLHLRADLERTLALVREAVGQPAEPSAAAELPRLAPDRRAALLARLKEEVPATQAPGVETTPALPGRVIPVDFPAEASGRRVTWWALAACLVGLVGAGALWLGSEFSVAKSKGRQLAWDRGNTPVGGVELRPLQEQIAPASPLGLAEPGQRPPDSAPMPQEREQLRDRFYRKATPLSAEPTEFSVASPSPSGPTAMAPGAGRPADAPTEGAVDRLSVLAPDARALAVAVRPEADRKSGGAVGGLGGGGFGGGVTRGLSLARQPGSTPSPSATEPQLTRRYGLASRPTAPAASPPAPASASAGVEVSSTTAGQAERGAKELADFGAVATEAKLQVARRLEAEAAESTVQLFARDTETPIAAGTERLAEAPATAIAGRAKVRAEVESETRALGRTIVNAPAAPPVPALQTPVLGDTPIVGETLAKAKVAGQNADKAEGLSRSQSAGATVRLGYEAAGVPGGPALAFDASAAAEPGVAVLGRTDWAFQGNRPSQGEERFGALATVTNRGRSTGAGAFSLTAADGALKSRSPAQDEAAPPAKGVGVVVTGKPALQTSQAALEALLQNALVPETAPVVEASPVPVPEVATAENSFSTFSLNVADVSFKLAGVNLDAGNLPSPASIRSEEFLNAFHYRDPDPAPGAPIAFAWERARSPFAHNRDLLRLAVRTAARGRENGRPLNLVLAIDNSGSMERADRVRILREAMRTLAGQLQANDQVSVVSFARLARLWIDGLPGSRAGELVEAVGRLTPEGGTNLEDALRVAYETALKHYLAGGVNRVVLLTDGAANLGDVNPESLKRNVESYRRRGVALDCFGIGWEGYHDDLLEALSRNGDGRYGFVNSPEEAATEFAGQLAGALQVAAADVKVQVEFNPRRVQRWRQVGYARHQLTQQQFRDNTVDAAEIGAAESGNALYVLELNPRGEGPIGVARVRFKVPATDTVTEHEWTLAYDGAAVPLEQASPALRLAACAGAFAESLANSPYAAEVKPPQLLQLLNGVPAAFAPDPRPARLEAMIRQAAAIRGQ